MEQRERHGWKEYHNPKDLAVALNIETSELLENFLWKENKDLNEEEIKTLKMIGQRHGHGSIESIT